MSCIYSSDFITLYLERLIFIPNQASFDLAPNIVAFNVNLAASLPLWVLENGDSIREGTDLCFKLDGLFFDGRGPSRVPRAPARLLSL